MEEPKPASQEDVDKAKEILKTPIEPALTVTYTKVRLHPEDVIRILTDKLPGYIPFFTQTGAAFPGCRLIRIDNFGFISGLDFEVLEHFKKVYPKYGTSTVADTVNEFFARFANYYRAHEFPDMHGGLYLYYSSILNEEDSRDIEEVSQEERKRINEKRAKRNADMAAAKEAKDKELADLLSLARAVRDAGGVKEVIENLRKIIVDLEKENIILRKKQRKGK